MSHDTYIRSVPIWDIPALRAAVFDLQAKGVQCELRENSEARMWAGRPLAAPFVLHLKNSSYDLAFTKHKDGYLVPVCDTWAGEVRSQIGWSDYQTTPLAEIEKTLMEGGMSQNEARRAARDEQKAEEELSHIGQLTQAYSNHALVNSVVSEGFQIIDQSFDAEGRLQIRYQ
jgi:hypothetical protein